MKFIILIIGILFSLQSFAVSGVQNNYSVGKTLTVAGGKVTSLNKVDGSFESGVTGWVASVGTITASASAELEGAYVGTWSGTGVGTLDLQWTASASNTYEASSWVKPDVYSDYTICAVVNSIENGCQILSANTWKQYAVVADSINASSFYLRLKHNGAGAFSVALDDAKIKLNDFKNVNVVEQESVTYTGYSSGTSPVVFKTKDTVRSNESKLISVSTVGAVGTASKYTILKDCDVTVTVSGYSSSANLWIDLGHYNSSNIPIKRYQNETPSATLGANITASMRVKAGDNFIVVAPSALFDSSVYTSFSITASAVSDNVVQSGQIDRVGETIYSIQSTAPKGFISAQGSILGKTSGSHQGSEYKALYDYAWIVSTTTAGEPYLISSAKGSSSQADWDAGKTITINESGLFTRASGGNAGSVGAKQLDAFQGHYHQTQFPESATPATSGNRVVHGSNSDSGGITAGIGSPITDGTNGTPRIAAETRPINIAKYVYIRYTATLPDLYALPTSKENRFSAKILNSGSASLGSTSSDFITSITRNSTGLVTVDYSKLGLTVAPNVNATILGTLVAKINSVSTTQAVIETRNVSLTVTDSDFFIQLEKQGADYVAPSVFVGNIQPDWQYNLTVTGGSSWATPRAVGVITKTANGSYYLDFSIVGTTSSVSSLDITFSGVTFKNVAGFNQGITVVTNGATYSRGIVNPNASIISLSAGAPVTEWRISGKVELESKPTWAVNTP